MKIYHWLLASTLLFANVASAKEVYIGKGSIFCITEEAAVEVASTNADYDALEGLCFVMPFSTTGIKVKDGGFIYSMDVYRIPSITDTLLYAMSHMVRN